MRKRPLAVTIIACVYIVMGAVGFAYHASEFTGRRQLPNDLILVELIRLIAVVSGVYMLRGSNWARWLALVWIGCHVILSAFHSPMELVLHGLLFAAIAYFLSRPTVAQYFRRT